MYISQIQSHVDRRLTINHLFATRNRFLKLNEPIFLPLHFLDLHIHEILK